MNDYCITYETPDGKPRNFFVSSVADEDDAIDRFRTDRALQIKYRGRELEIIQVSIMSKVKNMNYTKGLMRRHEK